MKKLVLFLLMLGLFTTPCFSADVWREGTGADVIVGTDSPADIDDLLAAGSTEPIDDLLQSYREGCEIKYSSATTITVGDGAVMVSNTAGTIRAMLVNASNTSVTFADIDTGSEEASKTYWAYAYCSDPTSDVDFDVIVSTNATTPTGITYYKRLGSFFNNSSSNILNDETITNDNNYYALQLGDWVAKSVNTVYQASTDGYMVGYGDPSSGYYYFDCFTDASNPPTTKRQDGVADVAYGLSDSFMCPVKKNDYYKVTTSGSGTTTFYWLPNSTP